MSFELNQIKSNVTKFRKCEAELVNNVIKDYKKGRLNSSLRNSIDYFIFKNILLSNKCIDNIDDYKWLFGKMKSICNNCVFPIKKITSDEQIGVIPFGIITENNIPMISETGSFLIIE